MASLPRGPPGAGRLVLSAVLLFILAIITARLLLVGDWAWGLAAVLVPVLFLVARLAVGSLLAAILVGFFAAAALLARQLLLAPNGMWALVLLGLLILASSAMAGRVATTLFLLRRQKRLDASQVESGTDPDQAESPPQQTP